MNANQHIAGGIIAAGGWLYYQHTPFLSEAALLCLGAAAIGSLLPDVDHPYSTINRLLILPKLFCLFIRHRTITHSVWMLAGIMLLAFTYLPQPAAIGLSIGYASHIILDTLTPAGVPIFYPAKLRVRFF